VNEARLRTLLARLLYDLAAAQSAPLVLLGDRLGLYRAMAGRGPLTPAQLAGLAGVDEAYLGEWLVAQAAAGYVACDAAAGTFELSEEAAVALADEASPYFIPGGFQIAAGLGPALDAVAEAFRTGGGVSPAAYGADLFTGMDRASRVRAHGLLLPTWLAGLDGVAARLEAGASVADVGCGRGAALLALAAAYPRARGVGFDPDHAAIEHARAAAAAAGAADRVRFEAATATEFPGGGYDLVTSLDCLHELADPLRAARHVRGALAPDGTWLVVEPYTTDRLADALGPYGRLAASVSLLYCMPAARAGGGTGAGVLRGERWVVEIAQQAGFGRVRRLAETPFNLVYEARP
jgi:SAM-dependent methyltransferase